MKKLCSLYSVSMHTQGLLCKIKQWCTMKAHKLMSDIIKNASKLLYNTPHSIKRLGEAIFIKLPLYEAKRSLEPIYINSGLFKTLFKKSLSWQNQADFIKHLFSVTLDVSQSTGQQCGWAFVDKQGEDPYGISLLGNQGSGRAYYTGTCFNIKGEKTPLATSQSLNHSNGILTMGDGIWSALVGNSLYEEFSVKPSQVLAILRIDAQRCIIVRIDESGELDRITHLYYRPSPLTTKQLHRAANDLARLEADKFIHRILHGAWSAGNTSLLGHLIDYDSVCAVKGRQPQFSFSADYPDNYFGFEDLGQLKILKSLCDHPLINQEGVQLAALDIKFKDSFKKYLTEGLVYLMGFEDFQTLAKNPSTLLKHVAEAFFALSHYTYAVSPQSFNTNYPSALFFHLYDFSAFFRLYPLLKQSGQFTISRALTLLMGSPLQQAKVLSEYDDIGPEELSARLKEAFEHYLIPFDVNHLEALEKEAKIFIEQYDHIFQLMHEVTTTHANDVVARAYVINEDRFYLFPVFSLESLLIDLQTEVSPQVIHRFIQHFIQANQRRPQQDMEKNYTANFRFFKEGFSHVFIGIKGEYSVVICLYRDNSQWDINVTDEWHIVVQHQLVPAVCHVNEDNIELRSDALACTQLTAQYSRDDVFLIHPYELYRNGEKIKLTDLFFPNQEHGYYL